MSESTYVRTDIDNDVLETTFVYYIAHQHPLCGSQTKRA